MRKISIGINWQGEFDINEIVEQAKIADDAGVYEITVAEAWGRDAFTILTVLARETRNIKLGTSIVNIFSRTPAALAQHFATLDELSGGRMIIGLGSSGPQVIEHFHGVKSSKPLTRTREYIDIINMLMREEPLNYDGEIFKLQRGFTLRFKPVRNHIPIHIASLTPKSQQQTAEIADGLIPIHLPRSQWKNLTERFYGLVEAAGRKRADVDIRNPTTATVTSDPAAARQIVAGTTAFYIARMGDFYYDHFNRMGYADEANAVRKAWAEAGGGAAAAAIPASLVDDLTTAGTVEECVDALEQGLDAGFTIQSAQVIESDPKKRYDAFRALVG